MEELSELIKELSKQIRCVGTKRELISEVADVYIVMEQIMMMYEITYTDIEDESKYKLARLKGRIEDGR